MSKAENKKKLLFFGGIALASVIGVLYGRYLDSLPQEYAIGKIEKIWKPARGNIEVAYTYKVANTSYKGSVSNYGYESIAQPGRRFLVEYPKDFPGEGLMLLDRPVPDSIEAPQDGWDEIPEF